MNWDQERLKSVFPRFVVFGAVNTLATLIIYVTLGLFFGVGFSYTVAYLFGLVIVGIFSNRLVFVGSKKKSRKLAYASWHVFVFGGAQLVLAALGPAGFFEIMISGFLLVGLSSLLNLLAGILIFSPEK